MPAKSPGFLTAAALLDPDSSICCTAMLESRLRHPVGAAARSPTRM